MAPSDNRSLKQIANDKIKENPSQLGDPVSLKAETSSTQPTKDDLGAKAAPDGKGRQTLKERAQEQLDKGNPTQLGDPVSLKAETSNTSPTPDDRPISQGSSSGKPKI